MPRYFLEVAYKGTNYSGFQVQENANSIQAEVENALHLFFRNSIELTGSSRTDTGVHALQNFFHFDYDKSIERKFLYNINSILPADIVVKNIYEVNETDYLRFSLDEFYNAVNIEWRLIGGEDAIKDSNSKSVKLGSKKMKNLIFYLVNYLQFSGY